MQTGGEINQNQPYYCDSAADNAQIWQADPEYLGWNECNNFTWAKPNQEEVVTHSAGTLQDLLYGISDPSRTLFDINPNSPEEAEKISKFITETPNGGPLVMQMSADGQIVHSSDLSILGLDNSLFLEIVDTACAFRDNNAENQFKIQPTAIKKYIENGDYMFHFPTRFYYSINGGPQRTKDIVIFIPLTPENTTKVIETSPYLSSTDTRAHGAVVTNALLSYVEPETDEGRDIKVACTNSGVPTGNEYAQVMEEGADGYVINRSMDLSFESSLISDWTNGFKRVKKPEWPNPIIINSLGNKGDRMSVYHPDKLIFGVAAYAINPLENPAPHNFAQYSNIPFITELSQGIYGAASGDFIKEEGPNGIEIYMSGTSMAAPFVTAETINYLKSISEEEFNRISLMLPAEIVNAALIARNAPMIDFNILEANFNGSVIVSGQAIVNSINKDLVNKEWTISPTGTIIVSDTVSTYNAARVAGLDYTGNTPIPNSNFVVTHSAASLAGIETLSVIARLIVTDANGPITKTFTLNAKDYPMDPELYNTNMGLNVTGAQNRIISLPTLGVLERKIKPNRNEVYLPLIFR